MNKYNVKIEQNGFWLSKKIYTNRLDSFHRNVYPKITQEDIKGVYKGDIVSWKVFEFPKEHKKVKKLCSSKNLNFIVTRKTYGWEGVTLYVRNYE